MYLLSRESGAKRKKKGCSLNMIKSYFWIVLVFRSLSVLSASPLSPNVLFSVRSSGYQLVAQLMQYQPNSWWSMPKMLEISGLSGWRTVYCSRPIWSSNCAWQWTGDQVPICKHILESVVKQFYILRSLQSEGTLFDTYSWYAKVVEGWRCKLMHDWLINLPIIAPEPA